MTGQTISHYRILEKLGEGGMGVVYKAEDTLLNRSVALKFLHATGDLPRLLREARAAASLNHPNICAVYEVDLERGFLAMEFVEGDPISARIAGRPLRAEEALGLAVQIGEGLKAAHDKGITHRDIKSGNILVTRQGQAKILDFGLARLAGQAALTREGAVAGTPGYMAPEQASGDTADNRTDIWALGAVLHEMLTGRLPMGQTGTLPEGVGRLVRKSLADDPGERYQHIEDMLVDLRQAGAPAKPARRPLVWASAAVAVAAAALAAYIPWPDQRPPGPDKWVQLTRLPDPVGQPALSPDGRMVTFVRGPSTFNTPGEIYVKTLPDGEAVPLTRDGLHKMSPLFSPDGSRIAYTVVEGGRWDTWQVQVIGGQGRPWLDNASGLTWTGKDLVLFSEIKDKNVHMAIVSAREDRAEARDVYVPARKLGMAHRSYLSPDGKWALIVEMDTGA